jgi:hypothetical protein
MFTSGLVADAEVDLILACLARSFAGVEECHKLASPFSGLTEAVDCADFDVHIWLFLIFGFWFCDESFITPKSISFISGKSKNYFCDSKKKFVARTMPTLRPAPPVAESVS